MMVYIPGRQRVKRKHTLIDGSSGTHETETKKSRISENGDHTSNDETMDISISDVNNIPDWILVLVGILVGMLLMIVSVVTIRLL